MEESLTAQSTESPPFKESTVDLIKVLADVYSDEEESESGETADVLRKENQELHEKLRKTEAKFLLLIDTLKAIYSVIDFIQ